MNIYIQIYRKVDKNMKKIFKKILKNKYSKLILLGGGLFIILIFSLIFFLLFGNKVTPDKLLKMNFSEENLASEQELSLEMKTTSGTNINISLTDERDINTDHIIGNIKSPHASSFEMYVTKIDRNNGVYYTFNGESIWSLKYVTKNMSYDDIRTEYVEKNNEINLSDINTDSFRELNLLTEDNNYVITGTVNYITTLTILSNLRQGLLVCDEYNSVTNFLLKNGLNLMMNVKMYFDEETKLLTKIEFTSNDENFDSIIKDNDESKTPSVKRISIVLSNISYDKNDIFVPHEVDKNSVKID